MNITRRQALAGASAFGIFLVTGGAGLAAASAKPAMTMFRSPGCNCCLQWAELAKAAGYPVDVKNVDDIMAVKARLGVPDALAGCHTTAVGGYVVEGHVPFEAVARLLREKPKGITGIAVPGMPAGSPGMGPSNGERIEVTAFNGSGAKSQYRY